MTTETAPTRTPESVERRERWIVLGLALVIAVAAVISWLTIPTDAELLATAATDGSVEVRIEAMNSLAIRGYWAERPPVELKSFLADAPPELDEFVRAMHGALLGPR